MALTTSGLGERRQVGGRAVSLRREARNIRKAGGNPQQLLEAAALERLDQGSAIGSADRDVRLGRLEDRMQAGLLRRQRDAVIGRATEPRPTTGGQGGGDMIEEQRGGGMLREARATAQPPREGKIDGKPASEVLGEMRLRDPARRDEAAARRELGREDIEAGPDLPLSGTIRQVEGRIRRGLAENLFDKSHMDARLARTDEVLNRGRQPQAAPPSTAGALNTMIAEDDDEMAEPEKKEPRRAVGRAVERLHQRSRKFGKVEGPHVSTPELAKRGAVVAMQQTIMAPTNAARLANRLHRWSDRFGRVNQPQ